jgi:hypothetical protein
MSFDQDPGEQANISAADFAIMCDELKHIRSERDELLNALAKYVTVITQAGGGDKALFMAAIREADNTARAVIAKVKG